MVHLEDMNLGLSRSDALLNNSRMSLISRGPSLQHAISNVHLTCRRVITLLPCRPRTGMLISQWILKPELCMHAVDLTELP